MIIEITFVVLLISLLLVFFFARSYSNMLRQHRVRIRSLSNSVALERSQINFRENRLNQYDFLRYNLNEALVVQPEILVERQ
ncbi:hypothetical protein [Candidatus Ulvibacter alkanivorans]|uniref:hypothetical protein n=1 Tax=Candidatus Ulvibacter alkanivorans TaxID=2267620 RepID=UPI000DF499DA|nr:hypothetical protein [Candidatus Ulvibacter alkanivorans]